MPDGAVAPDPDAAERAAAAADARLVGTVRRRLVAWSALSTLVVLVVLGGLLYVAIDRRLADVSEARLRARVEPVAAFVEGGDEPGRGPDAGGFAIGAGNTFLYLFDAAGDPVRLRGRVPELPAGVPVRAGLEAAAAAPGGRDVRTARIEGRERAGGRRDDDGEVPIRVLTRRVEAAADGRIYFIQAFQDRSTEEATLAALLAVLLAGGAAAVAAASGFGFVYARRALVPIRESLVAQRAALRRQREFAADASHELRTPLTVIRSSVEHLRRNPGRPVLELDDAVEDIDAEVARLTGLVDDLLLLARADSGAVEFEFAPADLAEIAVDAAPGLARAAAARGVRIVVDPAPAPCAGDAARLRQLVAILLDNAVRHSPRDGEVVVTVRGPAGEAAARRDGRASVTLEVADRGPGIRPEHLERLFDRFYRAPGAPAGGTGLGLAIARWIAERHGGGITAANGPAGGAVFRVELPAAGAAPAPPAAG